MNIKKLRRLSPEELKSKKEELSLELMKENTQVGMGTVPESPGKLKALKKTIARINYLIDEEEEAKE